MKILLYTDVHFSSKSSLLQYRHNGAKYSERLEGLVQSLSWAEQQAISNHCDCVICLGDFFDKPILNCEEITALTDIKWALNLEHHFIVGNHESNVSSLDVSSTDALNISPNFYIHKKVTDISFDNNVSIVIVPYFDDDNRITIKDIRNKCYNKLIVLSHNDIKMRYGMYESVHGFDVDDIEQNCDLFLNGHLHNSDGTMFCRNGLNLGNLSGQNFSEDATLYKHGVYILDTDTLQLSFIENPYAFNYYKLQVSNENELNNLRHIITKPNALVSVKCISNLAIDCMSLLDSLDNVLGYKIVRYEEQYTEKSLEVANLEKLDYLEQFNQFCLSKLGTSDIVKEEINEVIK